MISSISSFLSPDASSARLVISMDLSTNSWEISSSLARESFISKWSGPSEPCEIKGMLIPVSLAFLPGVLCSDFDKV